MNSLVIKGQNYDAPGDLEVQNFKTGGAYRFVNQKRTGIVNEVIVHETVTSSAKATVAVLQQRNLGVQLIVGGDGTVYQHGDLAEDFHWHASEHNPHSVGIEVVNPYYPKFNPHNSVWTRTIPAPWADGKLYVVPAPAQAEALCQLVTWLTSDLAVGLSIPPKFVGVSDQKILMSRTPQSQCGPGIYAHHYFGHMDGAWLVLYTWLRLQPQLDPADAYETACRLASGASKSIDLAEFYAQNPYLDS